MAMNPREKRLAVVVGVLGVLFGGWLVVGKISTAFRTRQTQLEALQREVRQKEMREAMLFVQMGDFETWERRSLPRDRELARSLYQNWLVGTLADARLANVQVDPARPVEMRDVYLRLPFTVKAQGSAAEIAGWMAEFYEADYLQQIREFSLQPIGRSGDLQLSATIEGLALPGADASNKLPEGIESRLDESTAKAAVQAIVDRNLFAAYVPPPPPRPPAPPIARTPPPKPAFDESKYTFLTSVVSKDGELEAWLKVRPTDELVKLQTGDDIRIGQFQGTLVRIGPKEIEVEQDGKRRIVALGKTLGEL